MPRAAELGEARKRSILTVSEVLRIDFVGRSGVTGSLGTGTGASVEMDSRYGHQYTYCQSKRRLLIIRERNFALICVCTAGVKWGPHGYGARGQTKDDVRFGSVT